MSVPHAPDEFITLEVMITDTLAIRCQLCNLRPAIGERVWVVTLNASSSKNGKPDDPYRAFHRTDHYCQDCYVYMYTEQGLKTIGLPEPDTKIWVDNTQNLILDTVHKTRKYRVPRSILVPREPILKSFWLKEGADLDSYRLLCASIREIF